jgi:hypothetical protein
LVDVFNQHSEYTNGVSQYSAAVGILPRFQNGYRIFGISKFTSDDGEGHQISPYQDMGEYIDSYALRNATISSINFTTSNDGNIAQDGAAPQDFSISEPDTSYVSSLDPLTHANNYGTITIPHNSLHMPEDCRHFDAEITINKLSTAKSSADYEAQLYSSASPTVAVGGNTYYDGGGGEGTINMEVAG